MTRVKRPWYGAWLTPIGAMVLMLALNLGVTAWLSMLALEGRDAQRIATRQVAEFVLCIAEHPPGAPERDACIDLVLARTEIGVEPFDRGTIR